MSEQVLTAETWVQEAEAALGDIRAHVRSARVARPAPGGGALIDLTTLEGQHYCVRMSAVGFQVLAPEPAAAPEPEPAVYETVYALLDSISQKYRESFGGELMNKLLDLAKKSEG